MHKLFNTLILFFILNVSLLNAQNNSKTDVRAAWLTTAYRLDWPQTLIRSEKDVIKQKQELTEILDQLMDANFNTILFQVRHKGTVLYPSKIEPYSRMLMTNGNITPLYDPLLFAIEECHKRGMECHAWLVTLPADDLSQNDLKRYPNKNRQFITYNKKRFLDPSSSKTPLYLGSIAHEIVTNYDIDGIHLDYIRYPENIADLRDNTKYKQSKTQLSIEDWRRNNITNIVQHIYNEVKKLKPWVKVSSSPVGKFSDTNRYSAKGWNAYNAVYQDVFKWMELGIQDQIYPMMYFQGNNFYPFALDWNENKHNTQVIPGLGIYFLEDASRNWSIEEVQRQIQFSIDNQLDGLAYFRVEFLLKDAKGVFSSLKNNHYKYPALQHANLIVENKTPNSPQNLAVKINKTQATISWDIPTNEDNTQRVLYNVYASNTYPVDISKSDNLLETYLEGNSFVYIPMIPSSHYKFYAVTAINQYHIESEATQLKSKQDIEILETVH